MGCCSWWTAALEKSQQKSRMKFEIVAFPQHNFFSVTPAFADTEIINSQCYWSWSENQPCSNETISFFSLNGEAHKLFFY